jgi:hypothetical protein
MKEVVLYEDAEKGIRKKKIDFILPEYIVKMCMETVSGKQLHIREGVVIRCARDNTKLRLKLINPKYKESGDEIS